MIKKILVLNFFLASLSLDAMQLNKLSRVGKIAFNYNKNKLCLNQFRQFSVSREEAYRMFGLPSGAPISKSNLKQAYYALAKLYHPDTNLNWRNSAENKFKNITLAYKMINDEQNANNSASVNFESLKKRIESDYQNWINEQEKIKAEQEYEQFRQEQEQLEQEARANSRRKKIKNTLGITSLGALTYTGHEIYKHYKQSCLEAAIMYGDNQKLKELLDIKNTEELNKLDKDGSSLLHLAVQNKNIEAIEMLVKAGLDLRIKDVNEFTSLMAAVYYGYDDVVNKLLKLEVETQTFVSKGSLLKIAFDQGHIDLAIKLIGHDEVEIFKEYEKEILKLNNFDLFCAMMNKYASKHHKKNKVAVTTNRLDTVDNLENAWKSYNKEINNSENQFDIVEFKKLIDRITFAFFDGEYEVRKFFKSHRSDIAKFILNAPIEEINKKLVEHFSNGNILCDTSLVHLAVQSCDYKTLSLLIARGADLNQKDKDNLTPIFYAKDGVVAQFLINNGADIHVQDNDGNTILHNALEKNNFNLVETLIKHKDLLKLKNEDGQLPLHFFDWITHKDESNGYARVLSILKAIAPDREMLNTKDNVGEFPFESNQYCPIALTLKQLQQNPNQDIDELFNCNLEHVKKIKPLSRLGSIKSYVDSNNIKIINDYLDKGYDLNVKPNGSSLLHYAVKEEDLDLVKKLLEKGIDVNVLNDENKTPIFYATKTDIIKYLIEKGANTTIRDKKGKSLLFRELGRYDWKNIDYFADPKNFEPDNAKNTVWHYLANNCQHNSHQEIIELIKRAYPIAKNTISAKNNEGETAISIAQSKLGYREAQCKTLAKVLEDLNNKGS